MQDKYVSIEELADYFSGGVEAPSVSLENVTLL